MTSEERVLAAFDRKPVDRVPRYDIFLPGFIEKWRKRHARGPADDIYGFYRGIDMGMVLPDQHGPYWARRSAVPGDAGGLERDSWGRLLDRRPGASFEHVLEVPVSSKAGLDAVPFGPAEEPGRFDELTAMAAPRRGRFSLVSGVLGIFMASWRLRGEEQLLADLAEDPAFAAELAARSGAYMAGVGLRVSAATATRRAPLWVYDELASGTGPLFSADVFARVYLEPYRRAIAAWRAAGIRHVVLHCDGNSVPLLPLLREAGFDGLQPVAPSAGMRVAEMRETWGDSFILVGGMDNVHMLPRASRAEIEAAARDAHEVARQGGVILGSHSIDEDVPVESYDAYDGVLAPRDSRAPT